CQPPGSLSILSCQRPCHAGEGLCLLSRVADAAGHLLGPVPFLELLQRHCHAGQGPSLLQWVADRAGAPLGPSCQPPGSLSILSCQRPCHAGEGLCLLLWVTDGAGELLGPVQISETSPESRQFRRDGCVSIPEAVSKESKDGQRREIW